MKFSKLIVLLFVILVTYLAIIKCNENDYDLEDYESVTGISSNGTVDEDLEEDGYEDEDECTVDEFIEEYSRLVLPDDYEEGKKMDFTKKSYTIGETIAKAQRLYQYQQNVTQKMQPLLTKLAPRLSELLFYVDLPQECMNSLARIGQAIRNNERWAMKFMDSQPSGKILSLQVNSLPFGEYDECLSIESPEPPTEDKPRIIGQYCALGMPTNLFPPHNPDHSEDYRRVDNMYIRSLKNRLNFTDKRNVEINFMRYQMDTESDGHFLDGLMRYSEYLGPEASRLPPGLCIPSTCDPKDIEWAINKIMFPITKINTIINPDCDYKGKPVHIDKYQMISLVSVISVASFCTICTIIYLTRDHLYEKVATADRPMSSITCFTDCFAIVPNIKAIFDCSVKSERFSALDGIRAILCFWMFMQHEYESGLIPLHVKKARQSAPYNFTHQLRYIFFINWNLTDTFFLMGGFLTCYVLLTKLDKSKGNFNYLRYALHRYLRVLPVLLSAIAITFLLELTGDGPIWPIVNHIIQKPCIENPGSTLLLINNYLQFPETVMCVPISWYSACDFQLYLLAPVIILILYYWPTVGMIWNIVAIILGSFIALAPKLLFGILHFFESYKGLNFDLMSSSISHHYWGIEPHLQLYVVGILLGYLIKRHPNLYLGGRVGEVVIWLTTWAMTFFAIFWHRNYFNFAEYTVTEWDIINWIALSKVCYAVGWFWAFYALSTGRGGFINSFFSWNGFKPSSYLSLEIYMLHLFVLMFRFGTTREKIFYSDYYVWTVMVYDYIATFVLSILVNVLVTKPFANVLDLVLYGKTIEEEKSEKSDKNNNPIFNGKTNEALIDDNDVIVLTNSGFDNEDDIKKNKNLINETYIQTNDSNDSEDITTIKM